MNRNIISVEDLNDKMSGVLNLIALHKHENIVTEEIETYIKELMDMVSQNIVMNSINLIDKVVETGEKTFEGIYKQFHVSALEIIDKSRILLRAYQIVEYDKANLKYILSKDITLIDFRKVNKIY